MPGYLLKNATVVEFSPLKVEPADLRIADGKITQRKNHLRPKGEKTIDLTNKIVMPGMICAHTHLYSTLARGMPGPKQAPKNFPEILEKIWWKLDRALDEESIYYSALIGAIEAALAGTTTIIDHHASPGFIRGSLDILREAIEKVGIRGVLCYEVTDRGGLKERDLGLEENRAFVSNAKNSMFRGLIGAHASFTLSDRSLKACSELAKEFDSGVHIHLAEDMCDEQDAQTKYGKSVVGRLADAGILTRRSVLAHGTRLSSEDLTVVKEADSWLVHNPRSNMNNTVGYAPAADFGERAALGTDGISSDMLAEAKAAFLTSRDHNGNLSPANCLRLLSGGHKLASELYEQPMGALCEGAVADLIILDYPSPTPLSAENLAGHFIFGINGSHVDSVMVAGRFIVRGRAIRHLDLDAIYRKAQKIAKKLWSKIRNQE